MAESRCFRQYMGSLQNSLDPWTRTIFVTKARVLDTKSGKRLEKLEIYLVSRNMAGLSRLQTDGKPRICTYNRPVAFDWNYQRTLQVNLQIKNNGAKAGYLLRGVTQKKKLMYTFFANVRLSSYQVEDILEISRKQPQDICKRSEKYILRFNKGTKRLTDVCSWAEAIGAQRVQRSRCGNLKNITIVYGDLCSIQRQFRIVHNRAALLKCIILENKYWAEAIGTANYNYNRLPAKS